MTAPAEILVVEDHALLHRAIRRTLTGAGFAVTIAPTGPEARAALADDRDFALLLVDIEVPGARAADLVEAFTARFGAAPVVVVSGHPFEAAGLGPRPQGRFHYLPKPFEGPALASVVRQALDGTSNYLD